MAKREDFRSLLFHKHEVDLAAKLAKLIKREEKIYNKMYRTMKNLTLKLFENADAVLVSEDGQIQALNVVLPQLQGQHDKAFKRYMETLKMAFPYAHPTMKAVEVSTETAGQIAFSVRLPNINIDPPKKKT